MPARLQTCYKEAKEPLKALRCSHVGTCADRLIFYAPFNITIKVAIDFSLLFVDFVSVYTCGGIYIISSFLFIIIIISIIFIPFSSESSSKFIQFFKSLKRVLLRMYLIYSRRFGCVATAVVGGNC